MGYPFNKVLIIIGQKYIGFKIMFKFAGLLRATCPNQSSSPLKHNSQNDLCVGMQKLRRFG